MDANEVYSVLTDKIEALDKRFTNHEAHCQERQKAVYEKIDDVDTDVKNLSRMVYIGFGVFIVVEVLIATFLPMLLNLVP